MTISEQEIARSHLIKGSNVRSSTAEGRYSRDDGILRLKSGQKATVRSTLRAIGLSIYDFLLNA